MQKLFYHILSEIEEEPAAYSIDGVEDIYVFIQGYSAAYYAMGIEIKDPDYLDFAKFDDWVQQKYAYWKNPLSEPLFDWLQLIRLQSRNNAQSLNLFFSLFNEFKIRNHGESETIISNFEYVIKSSFLNLFRYKGFKINKRKSSFLKIQLENDTCKISIETTRYTDNFVINFINPQTERISNFFTVLEMLKGENSLIQKDLLSVKSNHLKAHYFSQRFTLFDNITHPTNTISPLKTIDEIMYKELGNVLDGDFSFEEKIFYHVRMKRPRFFQTKEEEDVYNLDLEQVYKKQYRFSEEKVINEITNHQNTKVHELQPAESRYQLSEEEKVWIDKLQSSKIPSAPPISYEYITAFEKAFNVELPRYYKLYLNFIGNGRGIKKLERSIVYHDGNTEFYQFINLQKRFDEFRRPILFSGVLRIYDFGCGISYFLVVNGTDYGKIWIDDRANSGKIYPFVNSKKEKAGFKEWIDIFGIKNNCSGLYEKRFQQAVTVNNQAKSQEMKPADDLPF